MEENIQNLAVWSAVITACATCFLVYYQNKQMRFMSESRLNLTWSYSHSTAVGEQLIFQITSLGTIPAVIVYVGLQENFLERKQREWQWVVFFKYFFKYKKKKNARDEKDSQLFGRFRIIEHLDLYESKANEKMLSLNCGQTHRIVIAGEKLKKFSRLYL